MVTFANVTRQPQLRADFTVWGALKEGPLFATVASCLLADISKLAPIIGARPSNSTRLYQVRVWSERHRKRDPTSGP